MKYNFCSFLPFKVPVWLGNIFKVPYLALSDVDELLYVPETNLQILQRYHSYLFRPREV